MINRALVLEKWRDLRETVLIKVEVYEEHIKEQDEMMFSSRNIMRKKREETEEDLTKIKTKLEEQLPVINRQNSVNSVKIHAQDVIEWSIRQIAFLLPDKDNPYLKCDKCGLSKSSCNCNTVYYCTTCGSSDRFCGHTTIEEVD